jgi:hypothetical protein
MNAGHGFSQIPARSERMNIPYLESRSWKSATAHWMYQWRRIHHLQVLGAFFKNASVDLPQSIWRSRRPAAGLETENGAISPR